MKIFEGFDNKTASVVIICVSIQPYNNYYEHHSVSQ